jgi:iron complex transport system substrate-binding protein
MYPRALSSCNEVGLGRWLAVLLVFLGAFAFASVRAEAPPAKIRVVSQTVGTDELLLALAEPEQIAALSHLAREPMFSAVADKAKAYPRLEKQHDAEAVLSFLPSLVLVANYSRGELVTQLKRAGVKVIVIEKYETLEDAYENLRIVARELGAEQKAEDLIANCKRRVNTLAEKLRDVKPVRVIAPSTYGVIGGAKTTFQDLCDHAGAENLAATLGKLEGHAAPPNEQMLTWPIEVVVVAGDSVEAALDPFKSLPPYKYLGAVKNNRAVLLAPYQLSSVTHHRIDGYEQLARGLHPEVFR